MSSRPLGVTTDDLRQRLNAQVQCYVLEDSSVSQQKKSRPEAVKANAKVVDWLYKELKTLHANAKKTIDLKDRVTSYKKIKDDLSTFATTILIEIQDLRNEATELKATKLMEIINSMEKNTSTIQSNLQKGTVFWYIPDYLEALNKMIPKK